MSYILDALKKAERERGMARIPDVMTVHEVLRPKPKGGWRLITAAAALLIAAAVIFWFFWPEGAPRPETAPGHSAAGSAAAQPSAREDSAIAAPQAESAPVQDGTAGRTSVAIQPVPAVPAVNERPTPAPPEAAPPQQAPQLTAQEAKPQKHAATAEPEEDKPEPSSLPLAQAVSAMKITILAYSEDKAERMVFINDRKYVEGDYVEGKYLLESITAEGAILSRQGERALVRPR